MRAICCNINRQVCISKAVGAILALIIAHFINGETLDRRPTGCPRIYEEMTAVDSPLIQNKGMTLLVG